MKLFTVKLVSLIMIFILKLQNNILSACDNLNPNRTVSNCSFIDIFLLMDTSDKIERNEFDIMKVKLGLELRKMNLTLNKTNIALMTFSDRIKQVIPFTTTPTTSLDTIINKINLLEQEKNGNMLNRALHYSQLFILKSLKLRTNISTKTVVILLSDGDFNDENELRLIRKEANLLKMTAEVLAIRVGKQLKRNSLKMIVSCPSYLFDFNKLNNVIKNVFASNC